MPEAQGPQHVHGLGVIGDDVLLATHTGMWLAAAGATKAERVGPSQQDVMGFTVLDRGRILGSGHPDLKQDAPPNLGLIESRDQGLSFASVSLRGEADFHALTAAGRAVYGFDGISGRLLASSDGGRTWARRAVPGPVVSIAVDPARPRRVAASTATGLWTSTDAGRRWRQPARKQPAALLSWPAQGRLYAVNAQGATASSADGGTSWSRPQGAVGQPVAFTAAQRQLYVALPDSSVLRSGDDGRSWQARVAPG